MIIKQLRARGAPMHLRVAPLQTPHPTRFQHSTVLYGLSSMQECVTASGMTCLYHGMILTGEELRS